VVISADTLEIVEAVGSVVLGCEAVVRMASDAVVAAAAEFVVATSVVEVCDALGNVVAVIVL
jgi:hypothetical protein